MSDRNCLSYWFPPLEAARLPVPETRVVRTDAELWRWLDGMDAPGERPFLLELAEACEAVGWPAFLRTGHGSGKHEWRRTCCVPEPDALPHHVAALVEWSHLADLGGLPTDVWAARRMLDTEPLFTAFDGMPIAREFRVFVDGSLLEHVQPYWPPDAILGADRADWSARLAAASELHGDEPAELGRLARLASAAVGGGYWSVDLLQDRAGAWWITDMAEGERSFRWEPQ